jgi:hypothetical protein
MCASHVFELMVAVCRSSIRHFFLKTERVPPFLLSFGDFRCAIFFSVGCVCVAPVMMLRVPCTDTSFSLLFARCSGFAASLSWSFSISSDNVSFLSSSFGLWFQHRLVGLFWLAFESSATVYVCVCVPSSTSRRCSRGLQGDRCGSRFERPCQTFVTGFLAEVSSYLRASGTFSTRLFDVRRLYTISQLSQLREVFLEAYTTAKIRTSIRRPRLMPFNLPAQG